MVLSASGSSIVYSYGLIRTTGPTRNFSYSVEPLGAARGLTISAVELNVGLLKSSSVDLL